MLQTVIRFLIGGTIVSLFALLGDLLRPKGFAGLFAGAPAVALATLALTAFSRGSGYASLEARAMIGGAMAFFAYAIGCVYFLGVRRTKSLPSTILLLALWALAASCAYLGILRK